MRMNNTKQMASTKKKRLIKVYCLYKKMKQKEKKSFGYILFYYKEKAMVFFILFLKVQTKMKQSFLIW